MRTLWTSDRAKDGSDPLNVTGFWSGRNKPAPKLLTPEEIDAVIAEMKEGLPPVDDD